MSIFTRRSALRLELAALDATICRGCGHRFTQHLLSMSRDKPWSCKVFDNGHQACGCKEFVEPAEGVSV